MSIYHPHPEEPLLLFVPHGFDNSDLNGDHAQLVEARGIKADHDRYWSWTQLSYRMTPSVKEVMDYIRVRAHMTNIYPVDEVVKFIDEQTWKCPHCRETNAFVNGKCDKCGYDEKHPYRTPTLKKMSWHERSQWRKSHYQRRKYKWDNGDGVLRAASCRYNDH